MAAATAAPLHIGTQPDSGLITTQLGSLRRVVCASPKYLSERGTPERVQDLAAHDCVSFPGGHLKLPHPWAGQTPPPDGVGTRDDYAV